MLGIPNDLVRQIAKMPVEHTWAIFYMNGDLDFVEDRLLDWLSKLCRDIDVFRILRDVLFLYMEHDAILAFRQKEHLNDPIYDESLPVFTNAYLAAKQIANLYYIYAPSNTIDRASWLMEECYKGHIMALGSVAVPYPDGYKLCDPKRDPFFPVGMKSLYWRNNVDNNLDDYVLTRFLGIVDLETGYTFSTVSWKYCLYTNRQVYGLILEVAGAVFNDNSILHDFELSNNSGVCKMTVRRKEETDQPLINDGWQAVLKGINSYDKTEPVRYTFGYKNNRYRISLLLPEYTVSIQTQHTIPFEDFREKVLHKVKTSIKYSAIEASFRKTIGALRETKLADRDMLPLFCKYFDYSIVPQSEGGKDRLFKKLSYVDRLIKQNVLLYGKNAYALLHVIMEYVSSQQQYEIASDWELGKWVQDFLEANRKPNFRMSQYIGPDYYDVASWFGIQ